MSIRKRQSEFAYAVSLLILHAYQLGYEITFGDAWSNPCPICKFYIHKKNSRHRDRLAIDLNLFWNGKYLDKTQDHSILGEYWRSIGGIWGGVWDDGNHYQWPM